MFQGFNLKRIILATAEIEGLKGTVLDYSILIKEEAVKNSESLGLIISEYAETGCNLIQDALSESKSVLSLIG
jgi:hypothetical protein